MEFSRDLARVTHTFNFITAVAYLKDQYPHHKVETLTFLLNSEYYKRGRKDQVIKDMDVWTALAIIENKMPSWPEGRLFFSVFYGHSYSREEYAELNRPNYTTLVHLAKNLRKEVDYRINALNVIDASIKKIDSEPRPGASNVLAYWKDKRDARCELIINTVRNLMVDGRTLRSAWESQFWFMPKQEEYAIPLLFKRIDVPGHSNAVKVYVRARHHKLCICTRNSYLLAGI